MKNVKIKKLDNLFYNTAKNVKNSKHGIFTIFFDSKKDVAFINKAIKNRTYKNIIDFDNIILTKLESKNDNRILFLNFDIPYFVDDDKKIEKFLHSYSEFNVLNYIEHINGTPKNLPASKNNKYIFAAIFRNIRKLFSIRNKINSCLEIILKPATVSMLKLKEKIVTPIKQKYDFKQNVWNYKIKNLDSKKSKTDKKIKSDKKSVAKKSELKNEK